MKKLYVQEVIDFIEEHIEEDITIPKVSTHIGYSQFYLNKLFSIFTGMSIIQYVKKRKMEYCLQELTVLNISLILQFNMDLIHEEHLLGYSQTTMENLQVLFDITRCLLHLK